MYSPDVNSKRSKRRANRGFVDLQTSSRKHRRARQRQKQSNSLHKDPELKPGQKFEPSLGNKLKVFMYTGSGALKYH